jgi:hypothetical protein
MILPTYREKAVSYQLSAVSFQLSAISCQLSAISFQLSAVSYQLSAIGFQLSASRSGAGLNRSHPFPFPLAPGVQLHGSSSDGRRPRSTGM